MAVELLTPFSQVTRRSVTVKANVTPLTGTWVSTDANGEALLPTGAGVSAAGLVLEGLAQPSVNATFDGNNAASATVAMPSAVAANQIAVAYGVYRFKVGPEGYTTAVETANPGTLLYVTTAGKLDTTAGAGIAVAVVETASATQLVARTLAAG
jgi:hypothetical protein